jgi:outer membrane protein TolC
VRSGRIRGAEKGRVLDAVYGKLSKAEYRLRNARAELARITRQLEILTGRAGRSLEERPAEAGLPRMELPGVKPSAVETELQTRDEDVRKAWAVAVEERRTNENLYREGRCSLVAVLDAREKETGLEILTWNLWRERQLRRVNLLLASGDTVAKRGGEAR